MPKKKNAKRKPAKKKPIKKKKRGPGQPTKYNEERVAIILAALQAGNFKCVAAQMAGIHVDTLNEWEHRHPEFSEAVKRADAEAEAYHVERISKGERGWQSSAWWLERKHRNRWGAEAQPKDQSADDWKRLVIGGGGERIVLEPGATLIGTTWTATHGKVDSTES